MKTTFKLSSLALVLLLSACGSSDKGNGAIAIPQINGNASGDSGSVWAELDSPNMDYYGSSVNLNGDVLVVNGVRLNLADYTWNKKAELGSSVFGVAWNNPNRDPENEVAYAFGRLTEAANVPTTGSATYQGTAFYAIDDHQIFDAMSEFNVDFAAKTVNGRLYNSTLSINDTLPTATVNGDSFVGSANGRYIQGNFFGAQAEELGGIYHNDGADVTAAFGATKQ